MCYLVREHQAAGLGSTVPGSGTTTERPWARWAGATAILLGGLALATVVDRPSSQRLEQSAAPTVGVPPVEAKANLIPTGSDARQLPADDGVPGAPDVARAGAGPCHHGL